MKAKKFARTLMALGIACSSVFSTATSAYADEPFLGEVRTFGFNFCPRGWAEASGQLMPISGNSALFSLLGTIYGGDGRTTFALPDLRGRHVIGEGQGPGLSDRRLGSKGGTEQSTATKSTSAGTEQSVMVTGTHDNMSPYLTMKVCIALVGIYPSRQ